MAAEKRQILSPMPPANHEENQGILKCPGKSRKIKKGRKGNKSIIRDPPIQWKGKFTLQKNNLKELNPA